MKNLIERIKSEDANALIENVIVLPLIFIVIYALILMCFIIHDRSTVESAGKARRNLCGALHKRP